MSAVRGCRARFFAWLRRRLDLPAAAPARIYRHAGIQPATAAPPLVVNCNSLADILRFDPGAPVRRRCEFFHDAMERMEKGMRLYSFAQQGRLMLCCWAAEAAAYRTLPAHGFGAAIADEALVLFDLYTHPQLTDSTLIARFVGRIVHELAGTEDGRSLYLCCATQGIADSVAAPCGFTDRFVASGGALAPGG
jgi:hypothetical protein